MISVSARGRNRRCKHLGLVTTCKSVSLSCTLEIWGGGGGRGREGGAGLEGKSSSPRGLS